MTYLNRSLTKSGWRLLRPCLGALFLVAAAIGIAGCGEQEIFMRGTVRDALTNAPLDSVSVTQFWLEKEKDRILDQTYTDSLGNYLSYSGLVGCGGRRCRFMVVFEKKGYTPLAVNNPESADLDDVELMPE